MAESAQRLRKKLCPYTHAYFRLPFHLKSLRAAASNRRTKIMFLPTGMTKRENNQTRYDKRFSSPFLSTTDYLESCIIIHWLRCFCPKKRCWFVVFIWNFADRWWSLCEHFLYRDSFYRIQSSSFGLLKKLFFKPRLVIFKFWTTEKTVSETKTKTVTNRTWNFQVW